MLAAVIFHRLAVHVRLGWLAPSATLLNQPAAYITSDGRASQFVVPFPPQHFGLGTAQQYFAANRGDIPPFFEQPYSAPLEFSGYEPGHNGNVPFSESK